MRELVIKLFYLPVWVKITGAIIITAGLIFGAWTIYLSTRTTEWIDQPVMLRLLKGGVTIYTEPGGVAINTADKTWMQSGSRMMVSENSTILLQYFDGSLVKINGPADLTHNWSRSIQGMALRDGRTISLSVSKGKICIFTAGPMKADSVFEVITPSTVGVAQGTLFKISVTEDRESIWKICEGTVRVGSVTSGDTGAILVMKPLSAGEIISVPPFPEEWHTVPPVSEQLLNITRDIVQMAVCRDCSDVETESVSVLMADPELDLAVMQLHEEVSPGISDYTAKMPDDCQESDFELLRGEDFNIAFGKTPSIIKPIFPRLPLPEIWQTETEEIIREEPPVYISSIMDIDNPLGIAVDASGEHIFVVQGGGNRNTLVFDEQGNRIMTLAPPDTTPAERAPSYVAIDWTGTIYVSDRMRHTIDMYNEESEYLGTFTSKHNPEITWSPLGLATDNNGNLYVTDVSDTRHRIFVFNSQGEQVFETGQSGSGPGSFSFPNDIAVDNDGIIYVADSNNRRIQIIENYGALISEFTGNGEDISFPRGIDIDGRYLYVVDTFDHKVKVFDIKEQLKPVFNFGDQGTKNGLFNFPNGLALDAAGKIYITDRENNRVQILGYEYSNR